jgi:HSP20 family protein
MFEDTWSHSGGAAVARLPLDIYSTDDEIVITAAMPGVEPDEIEISIEDNILTIRGEIAPRLENVRYTFTERFHGVFKRSLKLNTAIELDDIEANFDNGVLTLALPKAEEVKPKTIKVQAN